MEYKKIIVGITSTIFCLTLSGCNQQGKFIDTQKSTYKSRPAVSTQLTEQELFGWDPTAEITEEDIQDAIAQAEEEISIPRGASLILVQSGEKNPDADMQKELEKYYKVATFSGIPPSKRSHANKEPSAIANSYALTLRYLGAKGRQSTVIVYWPTLQMGKFDKEANAVVWQDYQPGSNNDQISSLRYLTRYAVIDVKTGNWEMYSPTSIETAIPTPPVNTTKVKDLENVIKKSKQQTYQVNAQEIYSRFTSGKSKH
ncbi:hypothetical protein [Buttiauxella izardii]|uniref:Aminopeptidase n=1 Tax=Buttiauxella izardii TaxID=82991 RepID=A0A3A5JTW4_9ENTR|nr:hypothetical protein [Buttiauxella izardii]RJT23739.1 hypothetical protein D6029_08930 [Buttiauxella izardii]